MAFATRNAGTIAEKMRIDSSGNVLVGTTSNASTQGATIQAITAMAARRNIASAGGPAFRMEKSRATTDGTYTIVADTDTLGDYQFFGADGVKYVIGASVKAVVNGTPGVDDMPTALTFSTTADGAAAVTERMRITSDGRFQFNGSNTLATTMVSTANAVTLANAATLYQFRANATPNAANTSNVGFGSDSDLPATGAFGSNYGFFSNTIATGGATLTNNYGFYAAAQTVGTNQYAFYANNAAATNRWNFYAAGTADNYFAGYTYIKNVLWQYAPAPTSKAAAATLTAAELQTGILNTTGTTYTITLPTGTAIDTGFTNIAFTDVGFEWNVINTASGTITIAQGASGMSTLGTLTIATGTSARFRLRRTAANTYVLYRLG